MEKRKNIPMHIYPTLPRYVTAEELCDALGIKDIRTLKKLPIKRIKISRKCVRYSVEDALKFIERRTVKGLNIE